MNTTKFENGVTEHLHQAAERLEDLKADVTKVIGTRLEDITADVSKVIGTRIGPLTELVKKHPFPAIAIGLASGYVLVRVMRRAA